MEVSKCYSEFGVHAFVKLGLSLAAVTLRESAADGETNEGPGFDIPF